MKSGPRDSADSVENDLVRDLPHKARNNAVADDKIIARAAERNESIRQLSDRYLPLRTEFNHLKRGKAMQQASPGICQANNQYGLALSSVLMDLAPSLLGVSCSELCFEGVLISSVIAGSLENFIPICSPLIV